ncbi:MAG: hypothetical protein ACK53Y_23515, partial [bacterium]
LRNKRTTLRRSLTYPTLQMTTTIVLVRSTISNSLIRPGKGTFPFVDVHAKYTKSCCCRHQRVDKRSLASGLVKALLHCSYSLRKFRCSILHCKRLRNPLLSS